MQSFVLHDSKIKPIYFVVHWSPFKLYGILSDRIDVSASIFPCDRLLWRSNFIFPSNSDSTNDDCDQSSIQRIETVFTEISFDGTVFTVSYSSTKGPIIHGISHRYSRKRKLNQFILSGGTFTGASGSAIILVDAFAFDLCAKAISATHHCSKFRSAELRFLGLWTVYTYRNFRNVCPRRDWWLLTIVIRCCSMNKLHFDAMPSIM